jgi:phenylpropionate dioxygenase-like ring-hydroxylating dioxygenase large terminal subunit
MTLDLAQPRIFNNAGVLVEGWYWAMASRSLRRGAAKPLTLGAKELVVWRGEDGVARAMDAHCPHMGAHLAEGRVEGRGVRCLFHGWKIDENGRCAALPSAPEHAAGVRPLRVWPVAERYGLIWVYAGVTPRHPLPFVPELEREEVVAYVANGFRKNCHPNVMMINAIDEQHFASVHPMAGGLARQLSFEVVETSEANVQFRNRTPVPRHGFLGRALARFYAGPLTYAMSYWFASTGTVTFGPDRLRFHLMFATRPEKGGATVGQTLVLARRRRGVLGRVLTPLLLRLTAVLGRYFARGDTRIFQTIRFALAHPVPSDRAIVAFIRHTERQRVSCWSHADGVTS